eukprot:1770806-Amphidinium_carterae.2
MLQLGGTPHSLTLRTAVAVAVGREGRREPSSTPSRSAHSAACTFGAQGAFAHQAGFIYRWGAPRLIFANLLSRACVRQEDGLAASSRRTRQERAFSHLLR